MWEFGQGRERDDVDDGEEDHLRKASIIRGIGAVGAMSLQMGGVVWMHIDGRAFAIKFHLEGGEHEAARQAVG